MKMIRVLAGAIAALSAANLYAGEAVFFVTEEGKAVSDIAVVVDGSKKLVQQNGFVAFDVGGGEHLVSLTQMGEIIGEFSFTVKAEENAEVKVEIVGGETMPTVSTWAPGTDANAGMGVITGVLTSMDTGGAVQGARISVEGTEFAAMSDDKGYFELELPRGTYDLSIAHPSYGKKSSKGVRVFSGSSVQLDFDMSMSGSGVIEELVATGSYMPATDVAQKRDASSILESIDSEQFSKMGDSDAASALKRVSGVSLIGGQYAVVRGLAGRYISSSLNGGVIPSTNPLTRDVSLDLFPAGMLQGIEINKGFTPNLPGDSTGGAINMVTKGMPEERTAKLSAGLGVRSGVTGKDVISYDGGNTDWMGFDDGTREMPDVVNAFTQFGQTSYSVCNDPNECITTDFAASLASSFENIYSVKSKKAAPDFDIGLSYGNTREISRGTFGYYGDVSYKSKWGERQAAKIDDDSGFFKYDRSRRNIDTNAYGVLGLTDTEGNHELLSKTMFLRKTDDTTRRAVGIDSEGTPIDDITLQWVERSYIGQTFSGEHFFADQVHQLDWRFTSGLSMLYEPDRRTYQYRTNQIFPQTLERRFTDQKEDSTDLGVDYTFNMHLSDTVSSKLMAGFQVADKNRDTRLARFGIVQSPTVNTVGLDLESLLVPDNFFNGNFTMLVRTAATDSYDATDDMRAWYFNTETDINAEWVVTAGARFEDATQELIYVNSMASNDTYETDEVLPAVGLTWKTTDQLQLRFSYSQTVSRPGLTERSSSSLYDPETDEQVFGNSALVLSNIDNWDFRAEFYFDDIDNVSVGAFTKQIDNPIERTVPDASGSAAANSYTFVNQDEATVSGIEFDIRKTLLDDGVFNGYVSSNLSLIDSEVTLAGRSIALEGSGDTRELQGQSDVLVNVQFGIDHLATLQSVNVMLNYFSDRISKVGRAGRNEIEEGRPTVDVVYRYEMYPELTLGAKIQNLFDQKVKYTIFDEVSESWHDGTYVNVNMAYSF